MIGRARARASTGPAAGRQAALRPAARWLLARGPLATGLITLAGALAFVAVRLLVAADGDITRFVRAAWPYADRAHTPAGLFVFPSDGYDGQFYYRLALDPANLHRTAFGITMDSPYRLERIGYPALAWLASLGRHAWVPAALVAVNVAALAVTGVLAGTLARDCGRPAIAGLLPAGFFGIFIGLGCDLTEPVATACLLGAIVARRRGHPLVTGLALALGVLTRENLLIAPLAIGVVRLVTAAPARRRAAAGSGAAAGAGAAAGLGFPAGLGVPAGPVAAARSGTGDLAWLLPLGAFAAWQVLLRAATGGFPLLSALHGNSRAWPPFGALAGAVRMNAGLLWPPTGAAYIWFLEVAALAGLMLAALAELPRARAPAWERLALCAFAAEAGALSASIWAGHADLRSVGESYLFAVVILLSARRRLTTLALAAGVTALVAAVHQALFL